MKDKQFAWFGVVLLLLLFGFAHSAQGSLTPTLAWDANSEPDLAGYTLHYGTASGVYDVSVTLGLVTMYTLPLALNPSNDYYFAITAYNDAGLESGYSNEVYFSTHDTDGDGLLDGDEIWIYGTDPNLQDTDGNGFSDFEDLLYWGDDWSGDNDGDGIINILDPDDDNDGIPDHDLAVMPPYTETPIDLEPEILYIILFK